MLNPSNLLHQLTLKPNCLVSLTLKASICHKSKLPPQKYKPWPYERFPWGLKTLWLDPRTKKRLNENSKIIQVEGNVAAGKKDFAQRLANELGMKYLPPVDLEAYYINDHGFDYRALNPLLPERIRACDWEMFHEHPNRHSAIHMQTYLFKLRADQYILALRHLLNTGQGVVMCRTAFTEKVIVDAMHDIGWLPLGYLRGDGVRFYDWKTRYEHFRNLTLDPLLKPHLTIYLDVPVENCLEKIKASKNPMIANSKALSEDFLSSIEKNFDSMLNVASIYGHVLNIKSSGESFTEAQLGDAIDDIEELDFEYDHHDTRFGEWWDKGTFFHYLDNRRNVSTLRYGQMLNWIGKTPWYDIAGMGDSLTQVDLKLRALLYEGHVADLGYFHRPEDDMRISHPLKVLFGYMSFKQKMRAQLRTDFL